MSGSGEMTAWINRAAGDAGGRLGLGTERVEGSDRVSNKNGNRRIDSDSLVSPSCWILRARAEIAARKFRPRRSSVLRYQR